MRKFTRRKLLTNILKYLALGSVSAIANISAGHSNHNLFKANMVIVWKRKRKMSLFYNKKHIKTYSIRLGFNPIGHKQKEGDGRTPEGRYFVTHHNPNSAYHKSIGISYPNSVDKANALKRKETPGSDIFIHGGPKNIFTHFFQDWTGGCIAVSDGEIDEIYNLVPDGTVVYIYP